MPKKTNSKIPAPKKETYLTKWNLGLLYSSPSDPQIEKDMKNMEEAFSNFNKRYKDDNKYLENEDALLKVLTEYEKMHNEQNISKPILYFHYLRDLNANNTEAGAKLNLLNSRLSGAINNIIFFTLKLGKISKENQIIFLKSEKLKNWRYLLRKTFEQAEHNLSEAEEKILMLKSEPSESFWINGTERIVNNLQVDWKKKKIPLDQAITEASNLSTKERRTLFTNTIKKLESVADFAENELNAIIINKKIDDNLKKYPKPYSATVEVYQNEEKTVETLTDIVTKYFYLSHKFYKIKAKLLGVKELKYADRNANAGKLQKKVGFADAVNIVKAGFSNLDKKYADILDGYLKNGQIDVYPQKGKSGGGYCSYANNLPIFLLLNHTSNSNSVKTLGHEMGHAIHSELSKKQDNYFYREYSYACAETASTLFENFVFKELLSKLSKKEQIYALHDRLNEQIATIFRQIACFNFELELHNTIREKGYLPKEKIAELMNKHMGAYLGPIFKLDPIDGYYFVHWSHLRRYFYVYSYAFGSLVSRSMYAKWEKDKDFAKKITKFLEAGGSDSPENIFKSIGIDITEPNFFEEGLKNLGEEIDMFEKLVKEQIKI